VPGYSFAADWTTCRRDSAGLFHCTAIWTSCRGVQCRAIPLSFFCCRLDYLPPWTVPGYSILLPFLFIFICAIAHHGTGLDPTLAPKGTSSRARQYSTLFPSRHWHDPPGHVRGTRSSSLPVGIQRHPWSSLLVSSRHWHDPPGHVRGTRSSSLPVGIPGHS